MAILALALLLFPLAGVTLGEDPCKGMTVADCEISEDNIIHRYNFDAGTCERQCKRSDHCQFWRVYQNDSMELPECLHLRTNFHQVKWALGHDDTISGLYHFLVFKDYLKIQFETVCQSYR